MRKPEQKEERRQEQDQVRFHAIYRLAIVGLAIALLVLWSKHTSDLRRINSLRNEVAARAVTEATLRTEAKEANKLAADAGKKLDAQQREVEAAKAEVEASKEWVSCVEAMIYIDRSIEICNEMQFGEEHLKG